MSKFGHKKGYFGGIIYVPICYIVTLITVRSIINSGQQRILSFSNGGKQILQVSQNFQVIR